MIAALSGGGGAGSGRGETGGSDYSTASSAEDDKAMAYTMCQDFVKRRLRSPSTADFPWSYNDKVSSLGAGRWRVRGYVDAQNGFGAEVRTNFVCTVADEGESWTLENMVMD